MDATHDPQLNSWVASANADDTDFPIQNLPYGRYGGRFDGRTGVAIGDQVLDLQRAGLFGGDLHALMRLPRAQQRDLRAAISAALAAGSADEARLRTSALLPQSQLQMDLPCAIGDYTDFFTSIHHASSVGRQFRPENPLFPNYKWVPIGYHGRSSSIVVSGHAFPRPVGQTMAPGAETPAVRPSARLDYELELGWVIGSANTQGEPVPMADAEDHVFGVALFNDWSARDIQAWEYQPLGPFLAKNFASTLSPWIVTLDALAPFRVPFTRADGDPQPLPYMDSAANRDRGAFSIVLEVWLQTAAMRSAGHGGDRLSTSNAADAYWTVAQLVAHHTVGGCNLRDGDLFGSGTLSGPSPDQAGSLLELTQGGRQPLTLSNGETRGFLEDGDTVVLRGHCVRDGWRRIGLGECRGTVLAAR